MQEGRLQAGFRAFFFFLSLFFSALDHVDTEHSASRNREMLLLSSLTKQLLTSSLIAMLIIPRERIGVAVEGSLYPQTLRKRLSVAIPLESPVIFKVRALLNSRSRAKAL